ncbi:MAG: GatB/YqeY domain-containing protein [Candidatus Latescibacterota bacterium]|jgi:uncharacterized protein YqeY
MILEALTEDMKAAMKAGDKGRLGTIRMLMSEIKNARISKGEDLTEAEEQKVLVTYAKKRKEAIENARDCGRDDLVAKEQAEYETTMAYLPAQLDEDELKAIVRKHVEASGGGKQAFGQVMKAVMEEVGGQADGKTVSAMVKELM